MAHRAALVQTSLLVLAAIAGCDRAAVAGDAGGRDAGGDSGAERPDAGPPGEALTALEECSDVAAELYATPDGLPPFSPDVRGALLGCSLLETIGASELASRLDGIEVRGGIRVYLVAFRAATTADAGAISTALVVLPDVALSERVPLVVAMHGTVGLADACAPSRLRDAPSELWFRQRYVDAMLLAWGASGLPVIAPDYPGLGTAGTHAYASWIEPARSGIDAARALRALLPAPRLAGDTLVYGHSQGGGLALALASLASEAPDVELSAVVAFAPAYRITTLVTALRLPMFALDRILRASAALAVYAELSQLTSDRDELGSAFAPGVRARVLEAIDTLCYGELVLGLDAPSSGYVPPATVGELVDETFRAEALACADGGDCSTLAGRFVLRDAGNEPTLSAAAPPLLIVGSNDDEALAPGFLGCALDRVRREGAPFEVCMHTGPDHLGIVEEASAYAIAWALAARSGAPRPSCEGSSAPPRCRLF